nr:odorant receptor 2 [Papilio dardanus]
MKFNWRDIISNYTKTVGKRSEVDEIVILPLFIQRILGQQILDPRWTWKKYCIHQIIHFCIFVYVFIGTFQIIQTTKDTELVAEASYTLIITTHFTLKITLYILNKNVFRLLYVSAKTIIMDTIKMDSDKKLKYVLKLGSRAVKTFLFVIMLIPVSTYQLTTLWNYINGQRTMLSRSTAPIMPMTSPYYEISWFLHSIFLIEVSSTLILDMWFVLLTFFLCKANESLTKILKVTKKENESQVSYSIRLSKALRRFHEIHVKLNGYLIGLRKMYKWLALVPLSNAIMCTCLILLIMSKEINWRFAPHMIPMIAEIFTYNWFGEQLRTKVTEINNAILNFDWTDLNIKDKKSYYIILICTQNECGIKTAVGNELSLITMTTVAKVIYQVFAVLRTVDG